MKAFLRLICSIPLILLIAWWTLAIWYVGPQAEWLRVLLCAGYALSLLALLYFLRPFRRAVLAFAVCFLATLAWWSTIQPIGNKDWALDVSQIAHGEITGDTLVMRNVRDFEYRSETDFDVRYVDRTYDLSTLRGVDLFMSYWAGPSIAHTIMSWEFADGGNLAISIETRRDKSQVYSAVAGFFKQFEIAYIAADERDLVGLRTNFRGEDVYVYRLRTPLPRAKALLLDYLASMNALVEEPAFYNALTDNCTTTIRRHVKHINPKAVFDWRVLVNGYLPELLYERKAIDTSMPFPELKAISHINERAKEGGVGPGFSQRIRVGVPNPAPFSMDE